VTRITFYKNLQKYPPNLLDTLWSRSVKFRPVVRPLKTVLTLRSLLALALMLWCAGTGCMMVSYARAAANAPDASAIAGHMMAGSMAMDAHACCKAKHRSVKAHREPATESAELNLLTIPSTLPQSGVMNCCPLTSGSIVVASRSQSDDRPIVLQQSVLPSRLLTSSDSPPVAVPLRLPNRADSYLLDCAFLI